MAVPLAVTEPALLNVTVFNPLEPAVMPPVMFNVCPLPVADWEMVVDLFTVISPLRVEVLSEFPPRVAVPVLPDCTVMLRPTVNAPLVNSEALALPVVSPTSTAELALPNAPFAPDGASAPTESVPDLTVVVPL